MKKIEGLRDRKRRNIKRIEKKNYVDYQSWRREKK